MSCQLMARGGRHMWRHLESNRDIDEGVVFEISARFSQLCNLTITVPIPIFKYEFFKGIKDILYMKPS